MAAKTMRDILPTNPTTPYRSVVYERGNRMRGEYEAQTDVLAAIVVATPVLQNHTEMLT